MSGFVTIHMAMCCCVVMNLNLNASQKGLSVSFNQD